MFGRHHGLLDRREGGAAQLSFAFAGCGAIFDAPGFDMTGIGAGAPFTSGPSSTQVCFRARPSADHAPEDSGAGRVPDVCDPGLCSRHRDERTHRTGRPVPGHCFQQLCTGCIEVDDGNILFVCHSLCRVGVCRQILNQLAVFVGAPRQRRNNHRPCPCGARLLNIAAHVRGIGRVGVGFARGPFTGISLCPN